MIFNQKSKCRRLHLVYSFYKKTGKNKTIYCLGKHTDDKTFIKCRRLKYEVQDDSYHLGRGKENT